MGKPLDPGPPLTAAEEFCACEPPGTLAYVKAAGAALLMSLAGGAAWCGVAVASGATRTIPTVLIGLAAGWSIRAAAGRHRSTALGIIAAAATLMAPAIGFLLLRLPQVAKPAAGWHVNAYDFVMAGVAACLAYRGAGPSAKSSNSL